MSHTPGPWEISAVRTVDGNPMVVGGEGQAFGLIAECVVDEDARLIAAAPDMLTEMKAAAGYLRNARIDLETGATKATAIRTIDGGLKRLEAAIAKAEARQP